MSELDGLYYDVPLTNFAARKPIDQQWIIPQLFPSLSVNKLTGTIVNLAAENNYRRKYDTVRSICGEAKAVLSDMPSTIPFAIRDHSLTDLLADELRSSEIRIFDDQSVVEQLINLLNIDREVEGVTALKASLVGSGNTDSPTTKFDAAYNATTGQPNPIQYLLDTILDAGALAGARPNTMVISEKVANVILANPGFQNRAAYTLPPGSLLNGIDQLRSLLSATLGIPRVIVVSNHYYNAAIKNVQNPELATPTEIWGDDILLAYVEAPSLRFGGLGVSLSFNGMLSSNGDKRVVDGFVIERARNARRYADEFFIHKWYDDFIVNSGAGFLITAPLTA